MRANTHIDPHRFSCVVFDLDGTLADTMDDIVSAVQKTLDHAGFPPKSKETIRENIGGGARNLLIRCMNGSEELADAELQYFAKYYAEHAVSKTILYPFVEEVLSYYHERGYVALATAKARAATEQILNHFGIAHYFDQVVTADDVSNPKPAPDCINKIIAQSGINPNEIVLIGDTTTDMRTGKNAGISTCCVTYGYGKLEDIIALEPDFSIASLIELKNLL